MNIPVNIPDMSLLTIARRQIIVIINQFTPPEKSIVTPKKTKKTTKKTSLKTLF